MFYNTYLPDGTRRFCPPFTPTVERLREDAQGDYRLTAFEVSQDAAAFARRGQWANCARSDDAPGVNNESRSH